MNNKPTKEVLKAMEIVTIYFNNKGTLKTIDDNITLTNIEKILNEYKGE